MCSRPVEGGVCAPSKLRNRTASCLGRSPMSERWIHRKGSKTRGFRYVTSEGKAVRDATTLARIAALGIPPAWRDVHIAPSSRQAIQAWGFDVKGRKQY